MLALRDCMGICDDYMLYNILLIIQLIVYLLLRGLAFTLIVRVELWTLTYTMRVCDCFDTKKMARIMCHIKCVLIRSVAPCATDYNRTLTNCQY
jgi:hypothetical protein